MVGDELFDEGDLLGQFGGPGLGGRGRKSYDFRYLVVETVEGGLVVSFFIFSRFGILILGAQPADEAAFLFGGALVVEGDEAGEQFLLSCVLCLGVLCLDRQITPPVRLVDGGDVPSPLILGDRRSPPRSFSSTLYIPVRVSPG